MSKYTPSINDQVFIHSVKKKGIVKEINTEKQESRITYFDPSTDKRRTIWIDNKKLSPYKRQNRENFKYDANELIEGSKKFNSELKEYLAPIFPEKNTTYLSEKDTSLMLMAVDLVKVITAHNAGKIANNLKSVAIKANQKKKEELVIKVKYFADIEPLSKFSKGDWIDLRSADTIELKAGEFKLIPLGVGMKLPEGYEANVVPRSSTFKHFGIIQTNHYGVIDNSYSGNEDQWFFPAYALRDTVINKNDRICQFRINETMPEVSLIQVENLDENSRGGLGSTGKN